MRWFIWLCSRVHDDDNYSIWVLLTKAVWDISSTGRTLLHKVFNHNSFFFRVRTVSIIFFSFQECCTLAPKTRQMQWSNFFHYFVVSLKSAFDLLKRSRKTNRYFTVRLTVRWGGGVSPLGPDCMQIWKFDPLKRAENNVFRPKSTCFLHTPITNSWKADRKGGGGSTLTVGLIVF